jgi:hypothetical protein
MVFQQWKETEMTVTLDFVFVGSMQRYLQHLGPVIRHDVLSDSSRRDNPRLECHAIVSTEGRRLCPADILSEADDSFAPRG